MKKLMVGAAKKSFSPSKNEFPIANFEGQREGEELHARAIVVDDGENVFLFENFELGGVPMEEEITGAIAERTGIKKENMILTGTHNHSAPFMVSKKPFMGKEPSENDLRMADRVFTAAVEAAVEANAAKRPAKVGYGEGKSYINVNRDEHFDDGYWMQGTNFEGCSDKTVAVVKFVDDEGKLIAAITNYAMHSNCTFLEKDTDGKVKMTSDIPGVACLFMEEHYGNGAVVLWQSGCAGNQNPVYIGIRKVYNPKTKEMYEQHRMPGATYEQCVVLGQQHAIDTMRAIDGITEYRDDFAVHTEEMFLMFPGQKYPEDGPEPNFHRLVVDNLLECMGGIPYGQWPEKVLAEMIPTDEEVPARAKIVTLGDVVFYLIGTEVYNEIGVLCKESAKELYPGKHFIVSTLLAGPMAGYILDDASKGHKVFQSFGRVHEGKSNAIVVGGMTELYNKVKK